MYKGLILSLGIMEQIAGAKWEDSLVAPHRQKDRINSIFYL